MRNRRRHVGPHGPRRHVHGQRPGRDDADHRRRLRHRPRTSGRNRWKPALRCMKDENPCRMSRPERIESRIRRTMSMVSGGVCMAGCVDRVRGGWAGAVSRGTQDTRPPPGRQSALAGRVWPNFVSALGRPWVTRGIRATMRWKRLSTTAKRSGSRAFSAHGTA